MGRPRAGKPAGKFSACGLSGLADNQHEVNQTWLTKCSLKFQSENLGKLIFGFVFYRDTQRRKGLPRDQRKKEKLGDLLLSKGGVEWFRKGAHKDRNGILKSWLRLAELIEGS